MMKKLGYKYYYNRTTTSHNGNVQFYDQEESKLNRTIIANRDTQTLIDDKIIKKSIQ